MRNYGFLPDERKEEDYFFGGGFLRGPLLQEDGDWEKFLPDKEIQRLNGVETMNCTVYGTLNAIETMLARMTGMMFNYSERYTGVLAETTRGGNSPHKVAETIRKTGALPDHYLPFDESINTWELYYSPNPMEPKYLEKGQKFLQDFVFKHEWVFTPDDNLTPEEKMVKLKEALKYSPVALSVTAWIMDENGNYTKNPGQSDNHWCMLYRIDDFCHIYDSYDQSKKRLVLNYDFEFAKIYYLATNTAPIVIKDTFWSRLMSFIHNVLNKLKLW